MAQAVTTGSTGFFQRPLVRKLIRYSAASVAGSIVGEGSLWLLYSKFGWSAFAANIVSVTLGTFPNYFINRYWTWRRPGRERMTVEATVFWVLALVGLLVSTVFVVFADHRWPHNSLAVILANFAGFGVLWVGRFVFLDRVLYRVVEAIEEPHEEGQHHEPA